MRLFLLILLIGMTEILNAQQLPLLAQYRENHILLNPASISANYRNNNSGLTVGMLGRYQWVGVDDAPVTQTAYGSYFWEDMNTAFGGYLINDQTGALGFTGAYGQFGYAIDINRYGHKLSFGANAGIVQYRADISRIQFRDGFDPSTENNSRTEYFPDFGFGIFYHFDKFFYAGLSVPQIFGLNLSYQTPDGEFDIKRVQHGYLHFGGYLGMGEESFLEPAVWIQYTPNAPINVNLNMRALFALGYDFEFWTGGGYSTSGLFHVEMGFNLTDVRWFGRYDGFKFGISYDYTTAEYSPHFTSAYELHIGYYIDI